MTWNTFDRLNPKLIDQPPPSDSGYSKELKERDTVDVLKEACGDALREFPKEWWVEPRDWEDFARDNDRYKTWPRNRHLAHSHQGNSHECTAHSHQKGFTVARNKAMGLILPDIQPGLFSAESMRFGCVQVSPLSLYGIVNPGEWGGAMIRDVLNASIKYGFLPDPKQPRDYGFKHTLHSTTGPTNGTQTGGRFVPGNRFPDGCDETRRWLRVDEVIFPSSLEEAVCIVLWGHCVHVGRDGHAVPWDYFHARDKAIGYLDSYNRFLADSWNVARYAWQGSYAIISVTTPDDWLKPCG